MNLLKYLPPIIQEQDEIQRIMQTETPELQLLKEQSHTVLNNLFVLTADETGVQRFEKLVGISARNGTLELRKSQILLRMNDRLPYTLKTLKNLLGMICGEGNFSINVEYGEYLLQVKLLNVDNNTYLELYSMLHEMVPANMIIDMLVQHDLPTTYIDIYNRSGKVATFQKTILDWDYFIKTDAETQIGITPVMQFYRRAVIN